MTRTIVRRGAGVALTMSATETPILHVETSNPEETQELGERLGSVLQPGDVVLLEGELGAGKTCLAQGIARGLGIAEQVISPTFILIGNYRGRAQLYHADLYRLEDPNEVADLELANSTEDGVLIVEWPERDAGSLPAEHLLIRLEYRGPAERSLALQPRGARAEAIVNALSAVSVLLPGRGTGGAEG